VPVSQGKYLGEVQASLEKGRTQENHEQQRGARCVTEIVKHLKVAEKFSRGDGS